MSIDRQSRGFKDRFLSKFGKIDRHHIRDYLAQLLTQNQFLETIFDHLDEGIIVTDSKLRILYTNLISRRMLQWAPQKHFTGDPITDHCPRGELLDILKTMRKRPRPIEGYECDFGPEESRRLLVKAIALGSPEGAALAEHEAGESMWVFLLRDVTDRHRTIEEQSRAQRLASMALLTAGVAHEIKNPLNSLNIHAQILLREAEEESAPPDRENVRRAANVILEETARLTRIVNEFIHAARPTRPVMERKYLNQLIEDLARIFGPECEKAGIEMRLDLDPELPAMEMDAHLVFQALRNLVRNSIEAHLLGAESREAGQAPFIGIRTKMTGDTAALEIADNGPGIAEAEIDKIFEPYYTTKFNGTGLGLMVVYRIITQHGGSIHAESKPGIGTRFLVSLPLAERPVRLLGEPEKAGISVPAP